MADDEDSTGEDEQLALLIDPEKNGGSDGYTKRQWKVLLVITFSEVFTNTIYSLQSPFYPREAEEKGATASEFGIVFGVYQLAMFFASLFWGSLLGHKNPKKVYILGQVIVAISTMLFGFLDWDYDRENFIRVSIFLRMIEGAATAAFSSASFTIAASEFPDSIATTYGLVQSGGGVGLIIGPSFGGFLFDLGGFPLPFFTVGLIVLLMAILSSLLLPKRDPTKIPENKNSDGREFGLFIQIPAIALMGVYLIFASASIGFMDAMLEPHLRKNFGFTAFTTGMFFLFDAAMYAIFSPIWGALCDKKMSPKSILLAAAFINFIAVSLIGPAPGFYHPTLWMVCLGLIFHGSAGAAALVGASSQATLDAFENDFGDDVATYSLVGSLLVASYSLGAFIGTILGGVLLDHFGFRRASIFVLVNQLIIGILLVSSMKKPKKVATPEPLTVMAVESQLNDKN